jgi:hypothetical protein
VLMAMILAVAVRMIVSVLLSGFMFVRHFQS